MRHILSGALTAQTKFARFVRGHYLGPALKSKTAEQAALFFELVAIYCGAVILSMAGVAIAQPDRANYAARTVGAIVLLVIVVLELGRRGKVTVASWLLILTSLAVITRNSLHAGGIRSPGVTLFYVFPLIGALLLGERAGIAIALLCATIGLGLVQAERMGALPTQSVFYTPLAYWWLNCLYVILVFAVLHTAVKKINRAYLQATARLQERRRAELRLNLALKAGTIGFWESDRNFETFSSDSLTLALLGIEAEEGSTLPTARWKERVHPHDMPQLLSSMKKLTRGMDHARTEIRLFNSSGRTKYLEITASPLRDAQNDIIGYVGTVIDITEARNAEQELRQSQLHLALAQRVASIGSAAIDFRTGKWDWSDETYRIYGVNRKEFTPSADALGSLLHPDDRDELLSKPALALRGITPPPIEYRIRRPDGVERILRREATLVRDENGKVIGIVGTVQDVTDLRAAEREKDLLQAQLRQSQRLEAVGQLTGGIAHDFNNLLTVILGNAEAFEIHIPKSSPLHELAEITRTAAERGAALVRQLQAFSRQQPLDPRSIDVNQLVAGMGNLLRRVLGEDVAIETSFTPHLWRALVDAPLLESALLNLVVNARDAMPQGGQLVIKTQNAYLAASPSAGDLHGPAEDADIVAGQYVMIDVSDTGIGMDDATRLKAFEPFFTTKAVGKGSGLGLSMVYGFVTHSKGLVRIESESGRGTSVKVYLPRAAGTVPQAEISAEEVAAPGGHERILVVEDDELVRNQVLSQLQSLGYEVAAARDGAEAIKILTRDKRFDLLFTDVIMPGGLNGGELADQARQLIKGLRVLFTSGYAENAIPRANVERGVDLLNKPYRKPELAARLRAILDG